MSACAMAMMLALMMSFGCGHGKEELVRRGRQFAAQGKYEDAALQYRKALQKDPRYGEACLRLGQLLSNRHKSAEAFQMLSSAVELMPQSVEARVALGRLALEQRRYPTVERIAAGLGNTFEGWRLQGYLAMARLHPREAIAAFQEALRIQPREPEIVTVLVQTLRSDHQDAEAERLARQTLEAVKTYGPLYDALYSSYMQSGRVSEAEQLLRSKIANNPSQSFFIIQLAEHYWGQRALQPMQDLLKTAPLLEAGDFYRRIGKREEAASFYEHGLQADPTRRKEYLGRMAGVRLEQGRQADAAGALEAILKQWPEDLEAQVSRAALRMAGGQPEEMRRAAADFAALAQKMPENLEVRYHLAGAYRQLGRTGEARTALLEILRHDPRHRQALRDLADLAIRNRQPAEALSYAERLLAIEPENVGARLVRTSAWALAGRLAEVRGELRRLTVEHPEIPEVWLQMATLELDEGHHGEAARIYRRFYRPGQADVRPLRGLVAAKVAAGEFDTALATAQKLAADFPQDAGHWIFAGQLQQQLGHLDAAIADFRKAHEVAPENGLAAASLGGALGSAGRYSEAAQAYRRALALQPENPLWMNNLAWHLAMTDDHLEEAAALVQRALQKAPESAAFMDTAGMVYLKSRKPENAQQVLRALVRKHPNDPVYRAHLARALKELGRPQEAKNELQTALRNQPSASERADIQSLLDALQ